MKFIFFEKNRFSKYILCFFIINLRDGVYVFSYKANSVEIKKWHITYIMYNKINTKI